MSASFSKELILDAVSGVFVPGGIGMFSASDNFVINNESGGNVRIGYISKEFSKWFLSGHGKNEKPNSGRMLRYHKLRKKLPSGSVIMQCGGKDKAETTLSEMYYLMRMQRNGQNGFLANNGSVQIFYVADRFGISRIVYLLFGINGWEILASSSRSCTVLKAGYRLVLPMSDEIRFCLEDLSSMLNLIG